MKTISLLVKAVHYLGRLISLPNIVFDCLFSMSGVTKLVYIRVIARNVVLYHKIQKKNSFKLTTISHLCSKLFQPTFPRFVLQ